MAVPYSKHQAQNQQTQFTVIPGRETDMVDNATGTGAKVFRISRWAQFERFLILGSEGGSFYVDEQTLSKDNAINTIAVINEDGQRAVQMIIDISASGRAHKNDPALFALAIAVSSTNNETKAAAIAALPKVARIGTHLFHFAEYVEDFRGWGRTLKRAVAKWYTDKDDDALALQLLKYQQRDGWAHRDLIRLSHPQAKNDSQNAILRYVVKGFDDLDVNQKQIVPDLISAYETIKATANKQDVLDLINTFNLPREMVPTSWLSDTDVWTALLEKMPMTAMIRNLGTMSKVGILERSSDGERRVLDQLQNAEALKRARIHPISVLTALKTYGSGAGVRGKSTWNVNQKIVDALDEAFYKTFDNVEPTGKRIMMAIDVSGSMGSATVSGIPNLTAREAVAAMAMVTARVEDGAEFFGFRRTLSPLAISPRQRLDDVMRVIACNDFGSTDCAAPIHWAYDNKQKFDAFTVWTDNDTGTGYYYGSRERSVKPSTRLQEYRQQMQVDAKLVVCATQAYNYSIADPQDAGMLDVIGFDPNVPLVIADFLKQ